MVAELGQPSRRPYREKSRAWLEEKHAQLSAALVEWQVEINAARRRLTAMQRELEQVDDELELRGKKESE